ncbi:hypothetical protein DFH28DRAFT_1179143 [Melampsora americana]|nr:hypothetical protein DFH28DRAFT_1179143 [Melampsora americana]
MNTSIPIDPALMEGSVNVVNHNPATDEADQPVLKSNNELLPPVGPARDRFEAIHQVEVKVLYHIERPPSPTELEQTRAWRKSNASIKTYYSDSKKENNGKILSFKACLLGKSLNEFRRSCSTVFDQYAEGMGTVILDGPRSKDMVWTGKVGYTKYDFSKPSQFRDMVHKLEGRSKIATVLVTSSLNEARDVPIDTGTRVLIEQAKPGGGYDGSPSDVIQQGIDCAIQRHKILRDLNYVYGQSNGRGGDSAGVLLSPFHEALLYKFTFLVAKCWTDAIIDGTASMTVPPDNPAFRFVQHDLPNLISKLQLPGPISNESLFSKPVKRNPPSKLARVDLGDSTSKPTRGSTANAGDLLDSSVGSHSRLTTGSFDIKKEGVSVSHSGNPRGSRRYNHEAQHASSQAESDQLEHNEAPEEGFNRKRHLVVEVDSDSSASSSPSVEVVNSVQITLDDFLLQAGVSLTDQKTREILAANDWTAWTDFIPSLQMTTLTLTEAGIALEVAQKMIEFAHGTNQFKLGEWVLTSTLITHTRF